MFGRIRDAISAGNAAVSKAEADFAQPTLAWLCLDPLNDDLAGHLATFKRLATRENLRRLKILSCLSDDALARQDANCEFLPLPESIFAATQYRPDVTSAYIADRLAQILQKWSVQKCVWSGDRAAQILGKPGSVFPDAIKFIPLQDLEK